MFHGMLSDGFSVFILFLLFVITFFLGVSIGVTKAPDECDSFGMFRHAGTIYECKKRGVL